MTLSEETKRKIIDEAKKWEDKQYAGKTTEERQALGQFFTPPELVIRMIEKFDDMNGDILDPTAGGGALLVGCILAGADPKKVYANELDPDICENVLRPRLEALGVPSENIHIGDALDEDCLKLWSKDYEYKNGTIKIGGEIPVKLGSFYLGLDENEVKILDKKSN